MIVCLLVVGVPYLFVVVWWRYCAMCLFVCLFVLCACFVCLCCVLRVFSLLLSMTFVECGSLDAGVCLLRADVVVCVCH